MSRIHSYLFSEWRRTVSSKFFDTQVPSISTEEFVLSRHARCVLSRLRCNGHSLLLSSYLFKIGRIENPSCSACGHSSQDTFHLMLLPPELEPDTSFGIQTNDKTNPKILNSLQKTFLEVFDPCYRDREAKHSVMASVETSTEELVFARLVVPAPKSLRLCEVN